MAASIATTAMTATISRSVNPASLLTRSLGACGRDIGGCPGSALLSIGAVGEDLIGAALAGRSIDVGLAPRVVRDAAAFQIRTIPCRQARGGLDECRKSLRRGRVSPGIEIE